MKHLVTIAFACLCVVYIPYDARADGYFTGCDHSIRTECTQKQIIMPVFAQIGTYTCWAAASATILLYYGFETGGKVGPECTNNKSCDYGYCTNVLDGPKTCSSYECMLLGERCCKNVNGEFPEGCDRSGYFDGLDNDQNIDINVFWYPEKYPDSLQAREAIDIIKTAIDEASC